MLLVQMTIGGAVHYISNDYMDIEHFYDPFIASLTQVRVETKTVHGGFAEPKFGQIDLLPYLFGDQPPQVSCPIKIMLGVTGEIDADVIFDGTAHFSKLERDAVIYDLYGPSIDNRVLDAVYTGSLVDVFTAACTTIGLTLDSANARAVSPQVDYKTTGDALLIEHLSDIAAFFCHRFYIHNGVLTLVDCLGGNGPVLELTEWDIFPSAYTQPKPYKQFVAQYQPLVGKYRFVFSDGQGATDQAISLTDIQMRTVQDGVNEAINTGGTASAIDSANASFVPAYAVDASLTTRWQSLSLASSSPWWQFDFTKPVAIIEYSLMLHQTMDLAPTAWAVQGWDEDNAAWRKINDEVSDPDWAISEVRKFSLPLPTWEVTVTGSHSYGEKVDISPVCHTGLAEIQAAVANIKWMMELTRIELVKPLSGVPMIGQEITLLDESLYRVTNVWAKVAAVVWDFDGEKCVLEGEGELT